MQQKNHRSISLLWYNKEKSASGCSGWMKVLLVNLLAGLNFANVFLRIKNVWKIKKNVNKRDQNKKKRKNVFTSMRRTTSHCVVHYKFANRG